MDANEQEHMDAIGVDLMTELQHTIERTLADFERSVWSDRPITLPTLWRLFARRWANATWPAAGRYRAGLHFARPNFAQAYRRAAVKSQPDHGLRITWSPRW